MEIDEALRAVGGYRRWHLFAFLTISFTTMLVLASQGLIIVFIGSTHPYHCTVPEDVPLNVSLPLDATTGELSQCSMYVNSSWSNETTSCTDGWTYDAGQGERTIVMEKCLDALLKYANSCKGAEQCLPGAYLTTYAPRIVQNCVMRKINNVGSYGRLQSEKHDPREVLSEWWMAIYRNMWKWDLVCEYSILSEMSQVYYQIGAITGEIVASVLADRYGRRWVHVTCYVIIGACGCGITFVNSYVAFAVIRPVIALATAASVTIGITHLFELFDSTRRSLIGIGLEYLWTVAYMYMALVAWFVRDWRNLQLIYSLTCLLGLLNIFIVESPLWLLANNRREDAEESLQKMARYNGVQVPRPLLASQGDTVSPLLDNNKKTSEVEKNGTENTNHVTSNGHIKNSQPPEETGHETIVDLFRWPLIRKYMIISILLWFANNIVYYFLVLSTPSLGGDLYLNFLIGGLVEIPAFTVAFFLVRRGRRIPTCAFLVCAAVSLICVAFIPQKTSSGVDLNYLIIVVAMFGKFSITASFSFIILYTKELFPTNLRGTSAGVCNFLGRIGNMTAPFASFAAKSIPWVPNVILGIICFVVAMITLLLPETKDWPLPQSIADVYRYTDGDLRTTQKQKQNDGTELRKISYATGAL